MKKYKNFNEKSSFPESKFSINFEYTEPAEDFLQLLQLKFSNVIENYSFLSEENSLYLCRVNKIYLWAKDSIEAYKSRVADVFETLDRWIIQAVELENEAIKEFVKQIHDSLNSRSFTDAKFPLNSQILLNLRF